MRLRKYNEGRARQHSRPSSQQQRACCRLLHSATSFSPINKLLTNLDIIMMDSHLSSHSYRCGTAFACLAVNYVINKVGGRVGL